MKALPLSRVFTLLERGPVVLVTTSDGQSDNIMTITWTMVTGYGGTFAITTGPWNHSYKALVATRECVVAIPAANLLDSAISIGTRSGADTDKFADNKLTRRAALHISAPLIEECVANLECRVIDIIERHNIVVLETVVAHVVDRWEMAEMIHAVGDGTFLIGGAPVDRRDAMRSKLLHGL